MRGELLLEVGRIRSAWAVLRDASTLDRPQPTARHYDPVRLAQLGEAYAHDRAHRYLLLRDRHYPSGSHPAPAREDLLDARVRVDVEVTAVAVEAYRAAAGRGWRHPAQHTDDRVRAGLGLLAGLAVARPPVLPGELAAVLVDRLAVVAELAEAAVGHTPLRVPLPGIDCPVCGLRSLRIRQDSTGPGEWVAECRTGRCLCRGRGCPCELLERRRGRRHVWARDEWATFHTPGSDVEIVC